MDGKPCWPQPGLRNKLPAVMKTALSLILATLVGLASLPAEEPPAYDLVIYGPTSAGVAAAVQAKRMGRSVLIVGPDTHLGGLSAGGLGWTDSGKKEVIGGISREFYQRVRAYYDRPETWRWQKPEDYGRYRQGEDAQWTFEPHIAEQVFEDLVRDYQIPVRRDEWLNREPGKGVQKDGARITSITLLSGLTVKGRMFIDATYEGDLMAAAGVDFTVGREANAKYDETLNGVQIERADHHQFANPIDPYVIPGDPSSGLLPRIHGGNPGRQGEGDHRLQAYNYRVCLTRNPENRVPFPKPEGYDPKQYELLLRTLQAGSFHIAGKFDMLPNLKTDTNNHGSFSTDNIGMNYDYPEASYDRRKEILKEHETYQKGYFYFIANDPRVPARQRQWMAEWGLAKDEFTDNGHWPHQIYVREARRMVGDFVMTENHLRYRKESPRPIGMGSYNMDSHHVQRYVDQNGHARNEGDIQVNPGGPYPIDYGAILPKKKQAANLLVPVALSSSHIAYGSARMEPVFMILGQSAATAACLALEDKIAVQDLPYDILEARLLKDRQVLRWTGGRARVIPARKLKGIVADDAQLADKDGWVQSTALGTFLQYGYRHDGNTRKGQLEAVFRTDDLETGRYRVSLGYSAGNNRATKVPVKVSHADGVAEFTVNQQKKPKNLGFLHELGTFSFKKGKPASVTVSTSDTDGYVIIDCVQWLPVE